MWPHLNLTSPYVKDLGKLNEMPNYPGTELSRAHHIMIIERTTAVVSHPIMSLLVYFIGCSYES